MEELVQGDCCDYFTVPARCDYEICPVCFWEQWFGIESPDDESGANHGLTIREARSNFAAFGACCETVLKEVLPVAQRSGFNIWQERSNNRVEPAHCVRWTRNGEAPLFAAYARRWTSE